MMNVKVLLDKISVLPAIDLLERMKRKTNGHANGHTNGAAVAAT